MLDYRAATKSGKKVNPPGDLLRQWKTAKAELKHLIAKVHAKGLTLPANLRIYEVLAQEARLARETCGTEARARRPATRRRPSGLRLAGRLEREL